MPIQHKNVSSEALLVLMSN